MGVKTMIFTSYFSKVPKLIYEKNFKFSDLISVSRYDLIQYQLGYNIKSEKNLAPSISLLWLYKNKLIDWKEYCEKFYNQLYDLDYRFWNDFEKNFDGKVLLCYEKDFKHCHRYLIGKFHEFWTGKKIFTEID